MKEAIGKFGNIAFISYNHIDTRWAKWLRNGLEWYRLPSQLHNEVSNTRFVRPVFRDRDDLNSGILDEELKKHLEASKFLIVLCSPYSCNSIWVNAEINYFKSLGRCNNIIPLVLKGEGEEYFPSALKEMNVGSLLGIPIYEEGCKNRRKALNRIVSRMFDVSFDKLWHRYKRRLISIVISIFSLFLLTAMLVYWMAIPLVLTVKLKDDLHSLPEMTEGILNVNGVSYSFSSPNSEIKVQHIPGNNRGHYLPIELYIDRFYTPVKDSVHMTAGIHHTHSIQLKRDNTYETFAGIITSEDGIPICGATVSVQNKNTITDSKGYFTISFPLAEQSEYKRVEIVSEGYVTKVCEEESPSQDLKYILFSKSGIQHFKQ